MDIRVKEITVAPIASKAANDFVKRVHYSGKVTQNSQLHLGAYARGRLGGVMQFGPSLDKRKVMTLVADTGWHNFLELNRMAFADWLPRNSESRSLAMAFRLIRKHAPHVEWVVSFADGTQCGDGTIYRASGFVLTGIKKNTTIWELPDGTSFADIGVRTGKNRQAEILNRVTLSKGKHTQFDGAASMKRFREMGAKPKAGFQLRYVYFLNPAARERLMVPELPFSAIDEAGARMYKGRKPDDRQ